MDESLEALLLSIQAGPLEAPPWTDFVRRLRKQMDGNFANLIFRRAGADPAGGIEVRDALAPPEWLWTRYRERFASRDPIPYFAMQPGRVYAYDELEGVAAIDHDAFREDFLRAADFEHFLIFRVVEPSGCNIWVTVTRSAGEPAFGADDRVLCERLARALVPALACYSALLSRSIETQMYRRAADLLSFGVITLDSVGRIVAVDDAARRWVDEAGVLAIHGDRPHAVQRNVDLSQRIAAVMESTEAEAIHLGDADGVDLLLVPLASRADAGPRGVCMMLYLSGRRPSRRDISAHVAALFGLSDTQARLAMLLANGRTLAESAAEIGITEQTARTYSKDIYARTGTARQGELIQRILTSVAMLD
ncbi:helix-turn-helix transcriptional regulator [Sphingopyxis sp. OPL5]|uniref:helix-turn-helix transcriptional regulator n=1 Tax=Sphingopyxis sp. OPL5 TaxID=2486273 RepID=UPI00164DEA36|nr:helix-turn-helix transcriptional regulator [Sphingopyxis sp. OPL5]QNO28867.1 helix-turn-helix transcriptional regulator [Sphingopyxis sp. OPL5]